MKNIKNLNEEINLQKLQKSIMQAVDKVDPNLSYTDLAKVVAQILKDEYGEHNFKPFLKDLQEFLK